MTVAVGRARLTAAESLLVLVTTVGLLATAGGLLQRRLGLPGLGLTELLVVLGPLLFVVATGGLPARALGLRWPGLGPLAGGALVGLGSFYLVAGAVEPLVERLLPLPEALRELMKDLIVPPSGPRPLLVDLAVLAVAPALCEELLFRGALLEAWRPWGRALAALLSALAFGAFHLSVHKFVPTALLGLAAAAVALRAGSVLPAMVVHLVNNSLVVFLVRGGHDDPPPPSTPAGALLAGLALASLLFGGMISGKNVKNKIS